MSSPIDLFAQRYETEDRGASCGQVRGSRSSSTLLIRRSDISDRFSEMAQARRAQPVLGVSGFSLERSRVVSRRLFSRLFFFRVHVGHNEKSFKMFLVGAAVSSILKVTLY